MSVKKLKIKKAVTQPLSAKKGAVPCVLYASDETSASFAPITAADPIPKEKNFRESVIHCSICTRQRLLDSELS